eukprot:2860719-Lingulodinium_polyedra.AAC.1
MRAPVPPVPIPHGCSRYHRVTSISSAFWCIVGASYPRTNSRLSECAVSMHQCLAVFLRAPFKAHLDTSSGLSRL